MKLNLCLVQALKRVPMCSTLKTEEKLVHAVRIGMLCTKCTECACAECTPHAAVPKIPCIPGDFFYNCFLLGLSTHCRLENRGVHAQPVCICFGAHPLFWG